MTLSGLTTLAKISSRDILKILRYYDVADDNNVPRNIDSIKFNSSDGVNTIAQFRFIKKPYVILIDEQANDEPDYINAIVSQVTEYKKGEILVNPHDEMHNYAMPFHKKSIYLYEAEASRNRLDSELAKRYPDISRSTWQKYIEAGYVSVNGEVETSSKKDISTTDDIAIDLPEKSNFSKQSLPIIYIDDNVIVIDKPAGILTHSKGALCDEFTVADFFKRYSTYNQDTNRTGIVHRLDRDTSGILIGARNEETGKFMQKQFADRKIKKTYLAIVEGSLKHNKANIDLPIARNTSNQSIFRVDPKGKMALTYYEVMSENTKYSLVKLQPHTGRTHQLRVHMQYLNTPILGDRVYGKVSSRLFLHAYSLEVTLPGGERKIFYSDIPREFYDIFPNIEL